MMDSPPEITVDTPFNTPLESGLRTVIILDAQRPKTADLQRLIYLDYLLVHSGDTNDANAPESLHPATPFRAGEILVRRRLIETGINLMVSRGLLRRDFTSEGIYYRPTTLAADFVWYLQSPYATKLKERADWLASRFGDVDDVKLSEFMNSNLGVWGAEFVRDASLNRVDGNA
jgi:hypothetical protein